MPIFFYYCLRFAFNFTVESSMGTAANPTAARLAETTATFACIRALNYALPSTFGAFSKHYQSCIR